MALPVSPAFCVFLRRLSAVLVVTGSAAAWAAGFEDAMLAKDRGDYAKAFGLLRTLAVQGDAISQFQLSLMYANGQGIAVDLKESIKWLRTSAKRGNASAQSNLGAAYSRGRGVVQDHVRAYVWFSLAIASGSPQAMGNLDVVQRRMTPQQIVQAKDLAGQCLHSNYQGCD